MQRRSFFTLSALALLASSLPLSAFAIDEAKKEIVIGTTVGDFADMVTDSIKPQLEAKGYKVKLVSPWRTGRLTSTASSTSPIWRASPKTGVSLWRPSPRYRPVPWGSTPASWGI